MVYYYMAVLKTTMKRFVGSTKSWDPIYLANSADITYLGSGFTVAAGDGFTVGQEVTGTTDTAELIQAIINNLAKIDKVTIPALQDGSGVTNVPSTALDGVVDRTNLPDDVGGKGVSVETEEAKTALTAADVNVGDIVKVADDKVYLVSAVDAEATPQVSYMLLNDFAAEVAWARITGTPTTLDGYGITDAVAADEKVTEATKENAGKILVLNADGRLDVDITGNAETLGGHEPAFYAIKTDLDTANEKIATNSDNISTLQTSIKAIDASWITTGTIDLARLPASAIETLYITENATTLAALTSEQVQNGDTVKVAATGVMYFVTDETKLGTADYEQGLVPYSAGTASAVDWSGVLNKPTTLQGYGITDAIKSDEKVAEGTAANAGKLVTLNADGKLATSITGDAASVGGLKASDLATATALQEVTDTLGDASSGLVADVANLTTAIGDADSGMAKDVTTLKADMATANADITDLKSGDAITALAASKITGTLAYTQLPADVSGCLHEVADLDAAYTTLTTENTHQGDLVKLNNGQVYAVTNTAKLNAAEGYTIVVDVANSNMAWSKITDTPTTLDGYGITDAVAADEKVTEATKENAGKIVVLNDEGKLNASVTGDAGTLGGHAADFFAEAASLTTLSGTVGDADSGLVKDVTDLKADIRAVDAAWITKGTISIDRLPHGALERCVVVADDTARKALTADQVQTGDTVKVTGTGMMYFVVDDTKLAEDAGYEVYTAGTASAVDWSGIQNKPTTLGGYGITDAVATDEKVTAANAANAGKILVLNADGKLDVDITGHVDWANLTNAPASTVEAIDAAVEAATHTNRAVLDLLTDTDGVLHYNGKAVAMKEELDTVGLGSLAIADSGTLPEDAREGQLILEAI